jgi:hypothetical protein
MTTLRAIGAGDGPNDPLSNHRARRAGASGDRRRNGTGLFLRASACRSSCKPTMGSLSGDQDLQVLAKRVGSERGGEETLAQTAEG